MRMLEDAARGLVGTSLLRRHDPVDVPAELGDVAGDERVVRVRDDAQPEPTVAVLTGPIEFVGGLLLAFGLATRAAAAAALVAGLMAVAVIHVHFAVGYFWTEGGYEYPLLWGIPALSFVVRGGGRFSLDALVGRETSSSTFPVGW
jgi:uncharacterized membrane protein YphA (DoxX/SURF4 family)